MELWVKLVPYFFCKAKLAQLSKDCPQEVLLVHSQVVFGNLKKHRLRLSEVASSRLTEKEGQVLTNTSLRWFFELGYIFEHKSCKIVLYLSLELLHCL